MRPVVSGTASRQRRIAEYEWEAVRLLVLLALELRVMLVSPSTSARPPYGRAVPDPDFEEAIEADEPPTVTALAQPGRCATEANRLRVIFDNTVQETIQPSCCGLPPV